MKLRHLHLLQKAVGLLKVVVGLTTSAYDDIHTDKGIGHQTANLGDAVGKEVRIVAAVHQAEHLVASTLQRDVEMRHEAATLGHKANQVIAEQVGLYTGDAVALDALYLIKGTAKVDELLTSTFAKVANIDAGNDNLLTSLGSCPPGLLHQ